MHNSTKLKNREDKKQRVQEKTMTYNFTINSNNKKLPKLVGSSYNIQSVNEKR